MYGVYGNGIFLRLSIFWSVNVSDSSLEIDSSSFIQCVLIP